MNDDDRSYRESRVLAVFPSEGQRRAKLVPESGQLIAPRYGDVCRALHRSAGKHDNVPIRRATIPKPE